MAALIPLFFALEAPPPVDVPGLLWGQQQFHEKLTESRWRAHSMDYVDGVTSAVLRHPYTLTFDPSDRTMYVASFTLNHVVRLVVDSVQRKKAKYKIFVSGNELDGPVGMVVHSGSLYVASFTNDRILNVQLGSGELLGTFGNDEQLDCPEGIAVGPDDTLYVTSFLKRHITRYSLPSGEYLGDFAPPAAHGAPRGPPLMGAEDLAFDWEGDLHVTAYHSNRILKFNGSTGEFVASYGKGLLSGPVGIACGPDDGDLYVASYRTNQVLRFSAAGRFVGVAAGASAMEQQEQALLEQQRSASKETGQPPKGRRGRPAISSPSGLAFDPHDGSC